MTSAPTYELTNLQWLEAESIHIFREVAAEFERPVLLFSGGKDSVVMLHLAVKAFWPAPVPFPVMHVDTGQNFDEVEESVANDYEQAKPTSALPWDTVRPAASAVWDRLGGVIAPRDPDRGIRGSI